MLTDTQPPERVFISYSHDGASHATLVLDLANQLRSDGIDAICDQYVEAPAEGWPKWMDREIAKADFVLIICTQTYLERLEGRTLPTGKGVFWESAFFYQQIYDDATNTKFIPLLLPGATVEDTPTRLRGATRYPLTPPFSLADPGYEKLYRRITNQPAVRVPNLGSRHALSSAKPTAAAEKPPQYVAPTPDATSDPEPAPQNLTPHAALTPPRGQSEARKPLDIATVIGVIVNVTAIITFVFGNTTAKELMFFAAAMWVFLVGVAIASPRHRRATILAAIALPFLFASGYWFRQWRLKCPHDKVCVVFVPFARDDYGAFAKGIKRELDDLKGGYSELKVIPLKQNDDDKDQAFSDAQKAEAAITFWGDFQALNPNSAASLDSSYRIFTVDVPYFSQGLLFKNHNISNDDWSKSFNIQGDVQRKAVFLTRVALGLAAWKRRDFDLAILRLNDALNAPQPPGVGASDRAVVYLFHARCLTQRQKFAEAVEDYKKVLNLDPSQTTALREQGFAFFAENAFTESIRMFSDCIARDPSDARAFDGRGLAHLGVAGPKPDSGDTEAGRAEIAAAKADVQRAIELDPKLSSAYNHLGRLFLREDNKVAALTELDLAVKFGPREADAYAWQGAVLMRLDHYKEAIQAYSSAKKFAAVPYDTVADVGRAKAYVGYKKYDEAIADYSKALSCHFGPYQICDVNQSSLFQSRADAYAHKERYDEAIADLAQAVLWEKEPAQLAALYYQIGQYGEKKGDEPLALQSYSRAIDYSSGFANAYYARAAAHTRRGEKKEADADRQEYQRLTSTTPKPPTADDGHSKQ